MAQGNQYNAPTLPISLADIVTLFQVRNGQTLTTSATVGDILGSGLDPTFGTPVVDGILGAAAALNVTGRDGAATGFGGNTHVAGGSNGTFGGSVYLDPGAGSSAANDGELFLAGDANLIPAIFYFTGTPAATARSFFMAYRPMRVKSLRCIFSVAAGGTSTLTVTKDTGTTAPGGGTSIMGSSFNLNATANTLQTALLATFNTVHMVAGDRLAVNFANAIQSTAGLVIMAGLEPVLS